MMGLQRTFAMAAGGNCCLKVVCALACLAVAAAADQEEGSLKATQEEGTIAAKATSSAIAATIIGSMTFLMSLHYLTNHPDEDMRRYSYQVISTTISIFCAVLIFKAINNLVEEAMRGASPEFVVCAAFAHLLVFHS